MLASSAVQKDDTWMSSVTLAAPSRIAASITSRSRKSTTTVSGSRSAATIGGITAFNTPTIAATISAAPRPGIDTPGTIAAAISSDSAVTAHMITRRVGRKRGRTGSQLGRLP
jgi:hypothetical protein